jgi:hypothetical protein
MSILGTIMSRILGKAPDSLASAAQAPPSAAQVPHAQARGTATAAPSAPAPASSSAVGGPPVDVGAMLDALSNKTWHWCIDAPFDVLPVDRDLLIDMDAPFRLHLGFDGWQSIEDRPSSPLPFGRHGVRLTAGELANRGALDFTMYFMDEARWHGIDYQVRLASAHFQEGGMQPSTA